MQKPLDSFPAQFLDDFVAYVLKLVPSLRITFLASLGSKIHASSIRALFGVIVVPDDARVVGTPRFSSKSVLYPLLSNTDRYARHVKSLVIQDHHFTGERPGSSSHFHDSLRDTASGYKPIDAQDLFAILEPCNNLEAFIWESPCPPPDGVCEVLSLHNPKLTHFSFAPNAHERAFGHQLSRGCSQLKWDAPSLPLFSALTLTSLRVSRLSQAGSRALSSLLSSLGEFSSLEELNVNFVWLDDPLCATIVEAGRRLRSLTLSTSGTKLNDGSIITLIEGCNALEEFNLEGVQGRLSRSLWSKPTGYPSSLKCFRVTVNEAGPHHSWTTDHLLSLHSVPLESLTTLSVMRVEPSPRLENRLPVYDTVLDEVVALKPVPREFIEKIRDAKQLTTFECDWWAWSISDVKVLLESCLKLKMITICLDAPFSKLLALTSTFATLSNLRQLLVSVNPIHAPGKPPVPLLPQPGSSLPTPTESPVIKAKSALPQLLDFDQMQTQTCLANEPTGDPSMPLLRDTKRFVRKCPQLSLLGWYGKAGRGSWHITRPAPIVSKISINVNVEYHPPSIDKAQWQRIVQQVDSEDTSKHGKSMSIERVGQAWTGSTAEAFAVEQMAEQAKEDISTPTIERQGRSRKTKPASFTLPSAGGDTTNTQLLTPTRSAHSLSPVQTFSPLTPPNSEKSVSTILTSVSEDPEPEPPASLPPAERTLRRRAPSEPVLRMNESISGRTRSTTAFVSRNDEHHHHHHQGARRDADRSDFSGRGGKAGRGRGSGTGAGPGKGTKRQARANSGTGAGMNGEPGSSASGSRGRGSGGKLRGAAGSSRVRRSPVV